LPVAGAISRFFTTENYITGVDRTDARDLRFPVVLFRGRKQKHSLAIAMTGVSLGDRLLQIGCTDASLLAAISAKVGLSGRACAIVANETEAARARRGAEQGGVLLEVEIGSLRNFPFEDGAFNLIVIDNQAGLLSSLRPEERVALLQQAFRTLAPRGRIVVIETAARGGLGALLKSPSAPPVDTHYKSSGGAIAALHAEGFRAARLLAERDGLSFFEGVR
jgi:ubiquinone/menaquinone biosynthesis C-methylase UbiE